MAGAVDSDLLFPFFCTLCLTVKVIKRWQMPVNRLVLMSPAVAVPGAVKYASPDIPGNATSPVDLPGLA